ncbi:MAG: DUF1573 domain-containing protein, partial [Anaerolineales bacterium]
METGMNTQDTGAKATAAIGRTALLASIVALLVLGGGFGVWHLASTQSTNTEAPAVYNPSSATSTAKATAYQEMTTPQPPQSDAAVPATLLAQPASAEEMFSEFVCPCCGDLIGDCTCGMAAERRGFVTELVAAERNRLDIYLAYADAYGLDAYASEDIKGEIREYRLAEAPDERAQIALEPQQVNLGDVSVSNGIAETSIAIRNAGQRALLVHGLSTSCGCTTASVING